ncbi:uncharacterized protein [Palaemon carinicauda]|uniref:uncharacterized protein n=1 Tax=Palaemon carinicauda TaxID=392227 RepID=UPI0035B5D4F7
MMSGFVHPPVTTKNKISKILWTALLLLTISTTSWCLECYECRDCGDWLGVPDGCSPISRRCVVLNFMGKITKGCVPKPVCEVKEEVKATSGILKMIAKVLHIESMTLEDLAETSINCCKGDLCNVSGSGNTRPTIGLLFILSLLVYVLGC